MLSANAVPKCKGLMHTAKQPEITLHGATFSSVWKQDETSKQAHAYWYQTDCRHNYLNLYEVDPSNPLSFVTGGSNDLQIQ